jgi:hypothetical protein
MTSSYKILENKNYYSGSKPMTTCRAEAIIAKVIR